MTSHPPPAPQAPQIPQAPQVAHDQTTVVVAERSHAADGVVRLTLRHPGGRPLPAWTPGAHIDLLLPGGLTRQYSLCGDPAEPAAWQIAVLRQLHGRGGSAYIHDHLAHGTALQVRGPRNTFPLRPAPRHLFIAGGIGITAILPMAEAAHAAGADWRLLYGGRTRTGMAFLDRLARHGDKVLIRPQDQYGLLDLAAFLGRPRHGTLVHACGPEPLLRATRQQCAAWPPGTLGIERFTGAPPAGPSRPAHAFQVVLARAALTLTVPPDRSVLQVAEDAGIPVPFSCREGTCGTCQTDVLEGTPDHRDSLLDPDEHAAGDTMLICVSRSHSPRLVLDL